MSRFLRQAVVVLATIAFLTVSTAALAHGHADSKDTDESHCVMCRAAHGATHLIAAPAIALHFAPVQVELLVSHGHAGIPFIQQFSTQDRAPPQL